MKSSRTSHISVGSGGKNSPTRAELLATIRILSFIGGIVAAFILAHVLLVRHYEFCGYAMNGTTLIALFSWTWPTFKHIHQSSGKP